MAELHIQPIIDFSDLIFIPNDHRTKKVYCICGCPPSPDADIVPTMNDDSDILETIKDIKKLNFLTKPFHTYSDDEKANLKKSITEYLVPRRFDGTIIADVYNPQRSYRIENLFRTILFFPELISIREFLLFMEWIPEKNPIEFYICLEEALDNCVYLVSSRNWRNQTLLLDQVKVFFEDFHGDVNHEFIKRHEPNAEHPDGEIYYHTYPLHLAMARNMPKAVGAYLLSKGANPFLKNKHQSNAFYNCLSTANPDVFDIFMDIVKHERPDSPEKLVTIDPFVWACEAFNPSRICVLEKLQALGFNIDAPGNFPPIINLFTMGGGNTIMDYYKYQILVWMVEVGKANVNITGKNGQTLLHFFCREPPGHYIHPLGLDYILNCPLFSWLERDDFGISPCEYLLDYHLEHYHDADNDYKGAKLPNFLCQVILKTGLRNITDLGLPAGQKMGERLRLAKIILALKYRSLINGDNPHIRILIERIQNEWCIYYGFNEMNIFKGRLDAISHGIYSRAMVDIVEIFYPERRTTEETATARQEAQVYRALVKQIIMTDSIRSENETISEPIPSHLYFSDDSGSDTDI